LQVSKINSLFKGTQQRQRHHPQQHKGKRSQKSRQGSQKYPPNLNLINPFLSHLPVNQEEALMAPLPRQMDMKIVKKRQRKEGVKQREMEVEVEMTQELNNKSRFLGQDMRPIKLGTRAHTGLAEIHPVSINAILQLIPSKI
jgi:hypothetical protein